MDRAYRWGFWRAYGGSEGSCGRMAPGFRTKMYFFVTYYYQNVGFRLHLKVRILYIQATSRRATEA